MAQALFISESDLKEMSIIDNNVDPKLLESIIEGAQNLYIHPVLGTVLYKSIQTEIDSGTVSARYQTLLNDYIQPALIEWIKYDGAPELTFKVMNKSIGKHSDEFQQPATLEEIRYIMQHWRNKAEELTTRLKYYICANLTIYPEYSQNNTTSDIQPQSETYFSGLYLGDTKPRKLKYSEKYRK